MGRRRNGLPVRWFDLDHYGEAIVERDGGPTSSVADRADAWMTLDPDPDTRAELQALLEAGDEAELARRFAGRLAVRHGRACGPRSGPARCA